MPGDFILVVDDERELTDVLIEILDGHGHRARTAATSEEALAALEDQPRLVLLDWYLPDGHPERVATACRDRGIPVVLTTAAPDSARLGRLVGAAAVLEKPFDIDSFIAVIERVLAESRPEAHS